MLTKSPGLDITNSETSIDPDLLSTLSPIKALTGLRLVAAFIVYLYHLQGLASMKVLPEWSRTMMSGGFIGVPLFFTLSGFVICYTYYERFLNSNSRTLRGYLVARFARIYPMYLFTFLVAFAAIAASDNLLRTEPGVLLVHLTLTQVWSPDRQILSTYIYSGPSWSLGVEIFLYLSFPFLAVSLLKICRREAQLLGLGLITASAALGFSTWLNLADGLFSPNINPKDVPNPLSNYWLYTFPVVHLADFILGCVAARFYVIWSAKPVSQKEAFWGRIILLFSVMAILFFLVCDIPALTFYRAGTVYLPFFALIIFCLARYRTSVGMVLGTKPMVLLGEASYSLYLLQIYFVTIAEKLYGSRVTAGSYFYLIVMTGLLMILSLGTYTYIETPLRRWIRKLT